MNFKKLNTIGGWLVFLIALIVYGLTVEPTASYWDCGEFIAVSYKLQTSHPPGVPIYTLVSRLFSMFASSPDQIAYSVNLVSVLSSAFTIMLMFWTISYIARKLLKLLPKQEPTQSQRLLILSASLVGSLAFTFSDSFWFNAVEAEVYAMSMFFSAFVYWSMLKWDYVADEEGADKWILLTAYMMGLSLGVHILNLVMIPGLALIYYFRRFEPTVKGGIIALLVSIVGLGFILEVLYYGSATLSKKLDFILNDMGFAIGAGFYAYLILVVAVFASLIIYSIKKEKYYLNLGTLGVMFIMLGFFSYASVIIRSNGNPPIDENNPENPYALEKYLRRDQYGSTPLVSGPQFGVRYQKLKDAYGFRGLSDRQRKKKIDSWKKPMYMVKDGKWNMYKENIDFQYASKWNSFFPRMTHPSETNINIYEQKLERYGNYKKGDYKNTGWRPSFSENIRYMLERQVGVMYLRYFGWNFIGRDGDEQFSPVRYPLDNDAKPEVIDSMAVNNFFMLPFILGLLGFIYIYKQSKEDTIITTLLFLFGGVAIVVYLNAPAVEPRERDYAYAGSYYIFAIWIGLGVLALANYLKAILKNEKVVAIAALGLGVIVPLIMASEGWDDHDRSKRYYSVESAVNLLESCQPNAILFTEGDNDTFPLWFAQEVLGVRTDIRVCNTSLLGTSWYIEQMTKKAYESEPLPIKFDKGLYQEGVNDYARYQPLERGKEDNIISLTKYLSILKSNPEQFINSNDETFFPSRRFGLNFGDKEAILANGSVPEKYKDVFSDPRFGSFDFEVQGYTLSKDKIMTLELLSEINKDGWNRPIYFASNRHASALGLGRFLMEEGMVYRLTPLPVAQMGQHTANIPLMYHNLMENDKLKWTNLGDKSIHYSDQYGHFVANTREKYFALAHALYLDKDYERAKAVINRSIEHIPDGPFYYDMYNFYMASAVLFPIGKDNNDAEASELALSIIDTMAERCVEVRDYENLHGDNKPQYSRDFYIYRSLGKSIKDFYSKNGLTEKSDQIGL